MESTSSQSQTSTSSNPKLLSTERDYIYEEDFFDPETCKKLVAYFNKTIQTNNATNVNASFDNRVVYYESIPESSEVKGFMKVVHDRVASKLTEFYNLSEDNKIYPEATHLVIWPTGSSLGDHADNAYANGTPNYVSWRTHSAVVYLNDDFTGGQFYFKKYLPEVINPKTGLLVAFDGGLNFIHGVKKIQSGTRYAMPMWFTKDRSKAYPEYR